MRKYLVNLLIFMTLAAPSIAQNGSQSTDGLGTDSRLNNLVTYQATGKPLSDVADALTSASSIAIRAGVNSKDWEVRDRRINIFVKSVPLRDLMNSISRVTGFKWQVVGEDSTRTYRLVWDDESRNQIQTLASNAADKANQTGSSQIQVAAQSVDGSEFFPGLGSTNQLSPEQQAELRVSNPFLAWWQASGMSKAVGRVAGTVSGVSQALSMGGNLSMYGSQLTGDGRKAILGLISQANRSQYALGGVSRGAVRNIKKNLNNAQITVNQNVTPGSLGNINIKYSKWSISVPFLNSQSATAAAIGKIYNQNLALNRSANNVTKGQRGDLKRAREADTFASDQSSGRDSSTSSKETAKQAGGSVDSQNTAAGSETANQAFKLSNRPLSEELMRASKALKVSIISDWFGDPKPDTSSSESVVDPMEVLDAIAERYMYSWDKQSSVAEFQDNEWAEKSFQLIPESVLSNWRNTLKQSGILDINNICQMIDLTPGNFKVGIESDPVLSGLGLEKLVTKNNALLRLFASLSENEKNAVFSQNGLDLKTLPDSVIPVAKAAVKKNKKFLASNDIPLILHCTKTLVNQTVRYQFRVFLANSLSESTEWTLDMPKVKNTGEVKDRTIGPKITSAAK